MNKKELKQLFEKIKNDKETIEELYSKYNKTIYAIAFSILKNKEDSEDAVQNVFIKISSLEKEKLPNDKESTWIYTVTKNEALSILKKKNKEINIDEIYEIEEQNNEIDEIIDKENFNKLISKLSDKEKQIVSLKIISNLSFSQIGKLIDEPVNTVKWRYYKSIYRIKMLLGNLAMFIITFILGSTLKNRKKVANLTDSVQNAEMSENPILKDELDYTDDKNMNLVTEPNEKNEYNSSGETEFQKPSGYESILEPENDLTQNEEEKQNTPTQNQETIQNTIQGTVNEQENQSSNANYMGTGILGISSIFLIITISIVIFFKKHQLKLKKKTSK